MNQILACLHLVSFLFVSAVVTPALSQSETLEDLMADPPAGLTRQRVMTGTLRLFDSVLIYPMPDWMPREMQANPLSSTKVRKDQNGSAFRMEMIPKEDTFEAWRNLYAVIGLRDYRGNTASQARDIVRSFRTGCKPSNLNVRPLQGDPQTALLVVACGSFAREPQTGVLAAFVLKQRETTAAQLYRQWRGDAFRSEDPNQWPVTKKSFDRIVGTMIRSRLEPAPASRRP